MLGAHPRRQFLAQFSGIFIGTLVSVYTFQLVAPSADVLRKDFPAPAAQTWAAVARAMGGGLENLESFKLWSIVIGGGVGIVLTLLSILLPPRWARWTPSAAATSTGWCPAYWA